MPISLQGLGAEAARPSKSSLHALPLALRRTIYRALAKWDNGKTVTEAAGV